MKRKVVHCASKSLMFLATIPPAAQCLPIAFIVTIVCAIYLKESATKACCPQCWRRKASLGNPFWLSQFNLHRAVRESKKHAYYDKSFKATAFDFAAMVFETTG